MSKEESQELKELRSQLAGQTASSPPSWLHIKHTDHKHNGHACVIVCGGPCGTSALVCADGFVDIS